LESNYGYDNNAVPLFPDSRFVSQLNVSSTDPSDGIKFIYSPCA